MIRVAQGISQVGLHMSVAFSVLYAATGSVALGGVAAVIEPICNVLLLPLHDRVWLKIRERGAKPGFGMRAAGCPAGQGC